MLQTLASSARAVRSGTRAQHTAAAQRVIELFRSNLEEPLDLQHMAKVAAASPFHFNRTFREVAGIPPSQFLYALRLQTAAELLITSDRSVLDICYEVGYNSLGTFTRRFTELVGLPPTRFRALGRSSAGDELVRNLWRNRTPPAGPSNQPSRQFTGRIEAAEDFEGVVLVGLFPSAIPQGRPVAGALTVKDAPYSVRDAPDGSYFLLAAGLPVSEDPSVCFRNRDLPRGGGHLITIDSGVVTGDTNISLRAPAVTDPPMLVTLPLLIEEFLTANSTAEKPNGDNDR